MKKPEKYRLVDGIYTGFIKGIPVVYIVPVGRQEDKHGTR